MAKIIRLRQRYALARNVHGDSKTSREEEMELLILTVSSPDFTTDSAEDDDVGPMPVSDLPKKKRKCISSPFKLPDRSSTS